MALAVTSRCRRCILVTKMENIKLNNTVILGFTDVAAAGSRALMGVSLDEFTPHHISLNCFANSKEDGSEGDILTVFNPKQNNVKVSLAVINRVVPQELCHVAASEFIDFVSERNATELILLCALPNVDSKSTYLKVSNIADYQHRNTATELQIKDGFFNCLIQFALVENLSVSAVLVDGRKAKKHSSPNDSDGSKQCIEVLHDYLKDELHLPMNIERSLSIVRTIAKVVVRKIL